MKRLINRIFRLEEINGGGRCPTYLFRWTLFSTPWFKTYIHHFIGDDWSLDLHDHPKKFISIGLWGRYLENTPEGCRFWKAPWIRSFQATHRHRIAILYGETCWTLVIAFKSVRPWGFWVDGKWIPWREYVDSERADQMKSCS